MLCLKFPHNLILERPRTFLTYWLPSGKAGEILPRKPGLCPWIPGFPGDSVWQTSVSVPIITWCTPHHEVLDSNSDWMTRNWLGCWQVRWCEVRRRRRVMVMVEPGGRRWRPESCPVFISRFIITFTRPAHTRHFPLSSCGSILTSQWGRGEWASDLLTRWLSESYQYTISYSGINIIILPQNTGRRLTIRSFKTEQPVPQRRQDQLPRLDWLHHPSRGGHSYPGKQKANWALPPLPRWPRQHQINMHLVWSRSGSDEVCGYRTHYCPDCLPITHMINAINQFSNKSTLSDQIQEGLSSI